MITKKKIEQTLKKVEEEDPEALKKTKISLPNAVFHDGKWKNIEIEPGD